MSLVEVLVALVLLVVGLGGVLDLYARQIVALGESRLSAEADSLARERLARLQVSGYAQLQERYLAQAGEKASFSSTELLPESTEAGDPPVFRRDLGLSYEDVPGLPRTIRIAVRVSWGDGVEIEGETEGLRAREAVGYVVAP